MKAFSKHSAAMIVLGLTLLLTTSASRGGSIFDDDYTPPKRAEAAPQQPAPTTPETPAVPVPPNPAQPVTRPPDVAVPAPVNPVHHTLPEKASLTKCKKLFEEVYATELKDKSPAARRKLARTLLDEAGKNPEGSADRYMLLVGAIQAGEEGHSLNICFAAAKQLASDYGVDELATKTDAAAKTFTGPPSASLSSLSNIEALFSLSDRLIAEDAFATNALVESALQKAVPTIADPDLKTEAKNQIREVAAMRDARQKITPAIVKLKQSPDDPAANLAVGSYYCFQQGNWEKGLPLLAKSSDARLKELATTELAGFTDGDARMKLADDWVAAAAKLAAPDRPKAMQHAADFYRAAAEGGLTDLRKLAIAKRLAQIPRSGRSRRVDLINLFDPALSIVDGKWQMRDGSLTVEPDNVVGRVDFAYEPPEEYDFVISFTVLPTGSEGAVSQICYAGGHQFISALGGWDGGHVSAFDSVDGANGDVNKTGKRKDRWLTKGQNYKATVRVRKTGVESYLDGQLVTELKTDYSNMSLHSDWRLSHGNSVGLGVYRRGVRFESAEIIEITGEGKLLSGK